MDGKFLLYSSDSTYTAQEVVRMYLEKDFIEKSFRMIKTNEDLKPIRHRLGGCPRIPVFQKISEKGAFYVALICK